MRGNVLRNRSGGTPDQNSSFDSPVVGTVEQRKTAMARMQATTSNTISGGSTMSTSKSALEVENGGGKDDEQNGSELYVFCDSPYDDIKLSYF
jgi:hypothetical protein